MNYKGVRARPVARARFTRLSRPIPGDKGVQAAPSRIPKRFDPLENEVGPVSVPESSRASVRSKQPPRRASKSLEESRGPNRYCPLASPRLRLWIRLRSCMVRTDVDCSRVRRFNADRESEWPRCFEAAKLWNSVKLCSWGSRGQDSTDLEEFLLTFVCFNRFNTGYLRKLYLVF